MMEWKLAPSYKDGVIVSVDEAERKANVTFVCDKCGGSGIYGWGAVINGNPQYAGECFKCYGTGKIRKRVKVYTPDEYDRYIASQARAKAKREADRQAEMEKLEAESAKNLQVYLAENGYDIECPQIFIVTGDNTYAIKDELKELGCKFKREFGWYATHIVELPTGYSMIAIPFADVMEWNPITKKARVKDEAKSVADAAKEAAQPKSNSEFIGEEKERLRDLVVTYESCRVVESMYGTSLLYTFLLDENVLIWFCSGKGIDEDIQVGDTVFLTGTVKGHKEYKGVKQTYLSRCKVEKEG